MARKIADTKKMTHDEWLALRKSSIGGSEAAVCLGMNSYSSLLTLYADKMGLSKAKETTEAMRIGTDLEGYVAERWCEKTGKKVRNDFGMYADDDYDYMTANIDRKVVGENAGLECKTMGSFNGYDLDAGEIPSHYYCQCQHYMMVMGYDHMYLAILVLQRGLYDFDIERDDEFIQKLREAEFRFWTGYVEKGKAPEPDGSDASMDTLKEIYPDAYDTAIMIPGLDALVHEYKANKAMEDMYHEKAEKAKAVICSRIGDNSEGIGVEFACTWKKSARTSFETKKFQADHPDLYRKYSKTTETRIFRTKKNKQPKKKGA